MKVPMPGLCGRQNSSSREVPPASGRPRPLSPGTPPLGAPATPSGPGKGPRDRGTKKGAGKGGRLQLPGPGKMKGDQPPNEVRLQEMTEQDSGYAGAGWPLRGTHTTSPPGGRVGSSREAGKFGKRWKQEANTTVTQPQVQLSDPRESQSEEK